VPSCLTKVFPYILLFENINSTRKIARENAGKVGFKAYLIDTLLSVYWKNSHLQGSITKCLVPFFKKFRNEFKEGGG